MVEVVNSDAPAPAVPSQDLNGPAFMANYSSERAKRLRPEGNSQFIDIPSSAKFAHFAADSWPEARAPSTQEPPLIDGASTKFLILGAGFGALIYAVRLIQAGYKAEDVVLVDSASGFGGTWYWNRYPGLMCDVESYMYMPLLEEMDYMPRRKYASGEELRAYAQAVAEKFGLTGRALWKSEVKHAVWDDETREWLLDTRTLHPGQDEVKSTIRAQYVMLTAGVLNTPKLPANIGIESYTGHAFHTSRWDYTYTGGSPADPAMVNLLDKKVGFIGTGATAVQAVPRLAEWAKALYVFQRTPSSVDRRDNHDTEASKFKSEVATHKGWQRERMANFNAFVSNVQPPPEINLVDDAWTRMPAYSALVTGPKLVTMENVGDHVGNLHAIDFPRQERIHRRVDESVQDKGTAEKLKPWYPTWCKRPCFHDEYLPSFNRPNVHLVDTDGRGVDHITSSGIVVAGQTYDVDVLIFATGYRAPASFGSPGSRAGMTVKGRDGRMLEEKWEDNVATLHGVLTKDFPNLFIPGPSQVGVTANQTFNLDNVAIHTAYIISTAEKQSKHAVIEPSLAAEEGWSMQILARAISFAGMQGCTPSYIDNEGDRGKHADQASQMKAARSAIWGGGVAEYVDILEGWRNKSGMEGLVVV